jgi:hypothetical protein
MAYLKSTLLLLLAVSSQALALPVNHDPTKTAPTKTVPIKFSIVEHAAHHPPGEVAPTDPTPTTSVASTATPPPSNTTSPTPTSSPTLPVPFLATATTLPSATNLAPDPRDKYMIGMPTFSCYFRFQLNGKKDHYFLRGRNWNITGEQLENAVKKVVYNTPEWGISTKGGADKDGKFKPGKNATEDTITFKYSDVYVKDERNPVRGVQEFDAEVGLFSSSIPLKQHLTFFISQWYIPAEPLTMARDLEVEFERMLVDRPMYTARRLVGVRCPKMRDDEDSPWHPPVQVSDIGGGFNATLEVFV